MPLGFVGSLGAAGISAREAEKSRKWTRKMRRTAYQDTMQDLRDAGLNPILAYKTGPTPIGSAAMGVTPDFGQAMASGVNAAVKLYKAGAEKRKLKYEGSRARGESAKAEYQARLEAQRSSAAMGSAQAAHAQALARETTAKSKLLEAEIPRAEALKRMDESKAGQFLNQSSEAVRRSTGAVGAILGGGANMRRAIGR